MEPIGAFWSIVGYAALLMIPRLLLDFVRALSMGVLLSGLGFLLYLGFEKLRRLYHERKDK